MFQDLSDRIKEMGWVHRVPNARSKQSLPLRTGRWALHGTKKSCSESLGVILDMQFLRPGIVGSIILGITGCATYSPIPLPDKADLIDQIPAQLTQPLDMNAIATVAVLN